MANKCDYIPTTGGDKNTTSEPSDSDSDNQHYSYILECLHFLQSKPWVNPNDSNIATRIANMVLEVVPYFQNQADADALKKGKTIPEAFETTKIDLGQKERIEVTLADLFSLVPSKGRNAWLTDRLMESIIQLRARPYQPGCVWFCSDGLFQTCMAALSELNKDGCTHEAFEQRLNEWHIDGILPGREIPPDAGSMLFFHNPTENRWITVLAYVDQKTKLGHIETFGSAAKSWGNQSDRSLQYLLHCLSYKSRNLLFRDANWFEVLCCNKRCPQQSTKCIDCGVFAVHAAGTLLMMQFPDEEGGKDNQARIDHGLALREQYMMDFKEALDETDIAIQTMANRGD